MNETAQKIMRAFDGYAVRAIEEAVLQDSVARVLRTSGIAFDEQVVLGPGERIDFLCGAVGVELKTKGGMAPLIRQLARYAAHERIEALVVISTLRRLGAVPPSVGAKPVFTLTVSSL